MKKAVKVLSTAALLSSLAVPFAAPVSAKSVNGIDRILSVDEDYNFENHTQPVLTLKEDDDFKGDFKDGDVFRVVLSEGAEWNDSVEVNVGDTVSASSQKVKMYNNGTLVTSSKVKAKKISDRILEVSLDNSTSGDDAVSTDVDKIEIPLNVKLDDANGELKVKVDPRDSAMTGGEYTFATAASGDAVAVVEDSKTIGKSGTLADIRIDETNIGAFYGSHKVTLKLPSNFEFNIADADSNGSIANEFQGLVTFGGGYSSLNSATAISNVSQTGRTLEFDVNLGTATSTRGSITLAGIPVKADSNASEGDIVVNVSSSKISGTGSIKDADIVAAKYSDWGNDVKVEKVEEIVAGKVDNIKTAEITIKEKVNGSLLQGRDIDVEFPSWVKVVGVPLGDYNDGSATTNVSTIDGTKSKFSINLGTLTGNKDEIKFKVQLSVEANRTGDIEAVISGGGVEKTNLVVAKAVAPVTAVVSEVKNVKIGTQAQEIGAIEITEGKKEAIEKSVEGFTYTSATSSTLSFSGQAAQTGTTSNSGQIELTLPTGVTFANVPTVEVVDGNAEIEKDGISRASVNGGYNNQLIIKVKSESTKPAKVKISGAKITVDRTVPEGEIEAKIGGDAIVENGNTSARAGEFGTTAAASVVIAKTVTPAPGDTTASNIVFKLNSKTFTVDGKAQEMDAAPLVGWDRAFLPVRFAANALNVSDSNIIWDDKTSTFTIFKGDRVITGKVGDKFLTVNGVKVPMDVPVWRNKAQTNNRVMVPIRYLANALNANIEWNKETSEITISAAK